MPTGADWDRGSALNMKEARRMYLSGGPMHVDLTGHLDDNNGGDPTLLDYWRGTHYGGSSLPLKEGEQWSKVGGPIYIYVNSAADPNAMYKDAPAQSTKEASKWPYDWVKRADYTPRPERAAQRTAVFELPTYARRLSASRDRRWRAR